jgi:hypothetical protein
VFKNRAREKEYKKEWALAHKDELAQASHKWYLKNKEKSNQYSRNYYQEHKKRLQLESIKRRRILREKIFAHYGDRCTCCGETQKEFLSLDHINNDGAKHRRELGISTGGNRFYLWVVRNNYPPGLQVLCYNCNLSKEKYGYCPHHKSAA